MIAQKSQMISMDFVMTFVVYLFALSVFFFFIKNTFSYTSDKLDASADLIFDRLDQTYSENLDFLDGSRIDKSKLAGFLEETNYDPELLYDLVFRDFENPGYFDAINYCIYIENRSGTNNQVIANFAAFSAASEDDYNITITGNTKCGTNPTLVYDNTLPKCDRSKRVDAIVIKKPVLYGRDIMSLNIYICAKQR